jgi:hypothetical protein
MLTRQIADELTHLAKVTNSHRDQPCRLAVLKLDFGAPQSFGVVRYRGNFDLVNDAVQVSPRKTSSVVARHTFV